MSHRTQMIALCTREGIPSFGTTPAIRKRLADHLLASALSDAPFSTYLSAEPKDQPPVKKPKASRAPTAYNMFVRATVPSVRASGLRGRDLIVEVTRLWKVKKNGELHLPLLLTDQSSTDASSTSDDITIETLMTSLYSLSMQQLRASLAAHGHPVDGTQDELVAFLAIAMLA